MALPYFLEWHNLRRRMLPAAIAVVVAVVAWVGIGPLLSGGDEDPATATTEPVSPPAEPEPVAEVEAEPPPLALPTVLIANGDVAVGTLLRAGSIEWREWPGPVDMGTAAIKDVVSEDVVIGAVVMRRILDGELITWDSIMMPGHPGFISAALTRGMVAVTVEVDRATTDANIIYPGDRVDIILTAAAAADSGPTSWTIVRNSRVLAVGSTVLALGRYGRPRFTEGGGVVAVPEPDGANYTVEVGPADAERIAVATSAGDLTLAMRSIDDASAGRSSAMPARFEDLIPKRQDPLGADSVRIIRGGRAQPGDSA